MIKTIGVGEIPINTYLRFYAYNRRYSKEMVIEHTKDIYNIDITEECAEYKYYTYNYNIYNKYQEENGLEFGNTSRTSFNNQYKKHYVRFYTKYIEGDGGGEVTFDELENLYTIANEYHHIHPIAYGGSNDMTNIIGLSKLNHDLLHLNPRESERKYCYQALDYLNYLITNSNDINKKYISDYYLQKADNWFRDTNIDDLNLKNFQENVDEYETIFELIKFGYNQEMNKFYEIQEGVMIY